MALSQILFFLALQIGPLGISYGMSEASFPLWNHEELGQIYSDRGRSVLEDEIDGEWRGYCQHRLFRETYYYHPIEIKSEKNGSLISLFQRSIGQRFMHTQENPQPLYGRGTKEESKWRPVLSPRIYEPDEERTYLLLVKRKESTKGFTLSYLDDFYNRCYYERLQDPSELEYFEWQIEGWNYKKIREFYENQAWAFGGEIDGEWKASCFSPEYERFYYTYTVEFKKEKHRDFEVFLRRIIGDKKINIINFLDSVSNFHTSMDSALESFRNSPVFSMVTSEERSWRPVLEPRLYESEGTSSLLSVEDQRTYPDEKFNRCFYRR